MNRINNLTDLRKNLSDIHSVSAYEIERKKNLKDGLWGCVCGSRKFHLLQQTDNVKTICSKCGETTIIYWNGPKDGDSSRGSMRRLDTNLWIKN